MAPNNFPGRRPGSRYFGGKKRRIRAAAAAATAVAGKLAAVERTACYLRQFYGLTTGGGGCSDDDASEAACHGFSQREVAASRAKQNQLKAEADSFREELWLARGVILDQRDREAIKERAQQALSRSQTPNSSRPSSSRALNPPATAPSTSKSRRVSLPASSSSSSSKRKSAFKLPPLAVNHQNGPQPGSKSSTPANKAAARTPRRESRQSSPPPRESERPKVQILVPSWRVVKCRVASSSCDWRKEEIEEDLSDQAYLVRHAKAELEEQALWESWQQLRKTNKSLSGGRSKSRRWREAAAALPPNAAGGAAAARAQRVSSVQSEDSFSGRFSPRTGLLQEIHVMTAPPTPLPDDALSPLPLTAMPSPATTAAVPAAYLPASLASVSPHKYSSDILPPSPPLSPNNSPKSRRKASDSSRRATRSRTAETPASEHPPQSCRTSPDGESNEPQADKVLANPAAGGDALQVYPSGKGKSAAGTSVNSPGRSSLRGGRSPVKRLSSPKKWSLVSPRENSYPLRNQQLSRRTRQGSRR